MNEAVPLTPDQRRRALAYIQDQHRFNRMRFFNPYPKQAEFFALGKDKKERLLTAGNQLGKTEAGAFEATCHLTGRYPDWWRGRRWDRPVRGWICGPTSLSVRDTTQKKLLGEPGVEAELGTGMVPRECILDKSLARGVTDAIDTVQVRHVTGGVSVFRFKSYEQGRTKFQGETLDFIWNDEECPMEIYSEELARVTATEGMIYTTFTSLLGNTALTDRFWREEAPNRAMVTIGLKHALHIPPEKHAELEAQYLPYERVSRIHGGIMLGQGRVFTTPEEAIMEEPITYVPAHWAKIWGIDFGIGHPFAAVLLLWDRDNDVLHLHHCLRIRDALPIQHASSMRHVGGLVPVAWPKDGTNRDPGTGVVLQTLYRQEGLAMLHEHAQWPEGGNSTWAGVKEMEGRFNTARLRVAKHLSDWFEEYRNYHVKDGQIVKINDDLLSATRVGIMMKRYAKAVTLGTADRRKMVSPSGLAKGVDFDLF